MFYKCMDDIYKWGHYQKHLQIFKKNKNFKLEPKRLCRSMDNTYKSKGSPKKFSTKTSRNLK